MLGEQLEKKFEAENMIGEVELLALLKKYNVLVNEWGKGEAKTVWHLLSEINSGEAELIEENGELIRKVQGATVNVYYTDGQKILKLKEKSQVFVDGRERVRELEASIGEKLKSNESPISAVQRALFEELNITESLPFSKVSETKKGPVPSISYPGIKTEYLTHVFEVILPFCFYKPEGYIEKQKDKETIFVWEELKQNN
ncbi:hypothetical protein COX74_01210 [bacterium (Candidatus Gribaldobacteria) CG_4_10_14_0_2_um_filter_41_16]|uniref:Nudix hydrolase domain-containing protein n=3 Tax=Candidatus Gribaldobacteria TaxID=2798536 RepID=A0A2M7VIP9_9BACT|nr:MAG: hypothetical protein AUJ36_04310 [Parcubacteria group bacterium CG1_02_41_26]PIR91451.1 MAG: hypothetical protein COU03_02080 [bacterium (Candidatus Gribaldobacteria) CG10_big_fil_rev_8_21_14_0_10_41_12]PIX03031.1 MAG: hypothetical protein COZ78_02520 [bacterium (Candidatus Gribaldobacteria) CG_4_8_14_3_um_filter_42_11]PJA01721.1 MAG: hypothetical protein COX74_01210 [bacterium (Candidatus Gribaldobacteria) CG_4_10_14_0_2_um_filter_41_16]